MVIFHSYVSLPEGTYIFFWCWIFPTYLRHIVLRQAVAETNGFMYVYVNPMNFHHLPKLLASTLSVSSTRIAERRNARLFENGTPKLGDGPCERTNLTKKWVKISFPPTYDLQQFQCL